MQRYPKYKASGIEWLGEIPEHWRIANLKRVTQLLYGQSLSKENRVEGDIPVYGSNGVVGYHNEAITKYPCIIIGRKGSFGKVNYSERSCFPIDTTFYVDATATNNNIRWLYYLLLVSKLDSVSKDSAVPGLNREEAYEKIAFIPPLPEQHAIATYLDHKTSQIDTYIAKKQQQIALLQKYRTALINQAVTKGLNPAAPLKDSGIEWLGKIPAHWDSIKFKFITTFLNGYAFNADRYVEKGIPLIRIGDVKAEIDLSVCKKVPYSFLENQKTFKVNFGDILLALTGATIGKSTVFELKEDALLNQRVAIIRPVKEKISNKFLKYIIDSNFFKEHVQFECEGGAQANIGKPEIGAFNVTLPSLPEQQAIAAYLDEQTAKIDTLIAKTEEQIERLQKYRTSLISDAVTGKFDVRASESWTDKLDNNDIGAYVKHEHDLGGESV